jgi:hypothetical protein
LSRPRSRSNVEIVVVSCAVVDNRGAPVTGLTREDFRVYDNGTRADVTVRARKT